MKRTAPSRTERTTTLPLLGGEGRGEGELPLAITRPLDVRDPRVRP